MPKTLQQALEYCVERQRDFPDLLAFIYGECPRDVDEKFRVALDRKRTEEEAHYHFIRVAGDALCPGCQKPYRVHPQDQERKGYDGQPFLRIACTGTRVKL